MLQHLKLLIVVTMLYYFVEQVNERLETSLALYSQILRCCTSVSALRPMGASAGQRLFGTSIFK